MMKWEMEIEEIEAVLEKIWDLHDKLSDAIHSISRSHFLNSIKTLKKSDDVYFARDNNEKKKPTNNNGNEERNGFVFMKEYRLVDDAAIAEAKSLNAIRAALENLEDQLEFFHTVQTQQRAERDAAIARIEQSRVVLAMRLADHHGKQYRVIEEALAFVGGVHDSTRFVTPENLFGSPKSRSGENLVNHEGKCSSIVLRMLSSFVFVKKSLKLDQMGGILGSAALVAGSMLALLHLHQVNFKNNFSVEIPQSQDVLSYGKRSSKKFSGENSSSNGRARDLDVFAARG
ncbi:plastid division protein PDV1 [Papaver somniferum]|uniref:plastid division protein PDV1 n=1 Tax=Papaver somniferum TaxID=3469 RepID=UPI000E6FF9C6|nr:plastid division protein PDV1 [Papaver somniferum]